MQLVPLNRHSPLPELQAFVSLFKPRSIVPNTLDIKLQDLDRVAIERVFAPCLSLAIPRKIFEADAKAISRQLRNLEKALLPKGVDESDLGDVSLKNLIGGNDALDLASRWASLDLDSRMGRKLSLLKEWLGLDARIPLPNSSPPSRHQRGRQSNPTTSSPLKGKGKDAEDFEDTDDSDDDDERGRTAHKLFGYQAGIIDSSDYEDTSSQSFDLHALEDGCKTPIPAPGAGPSRATMLTPQTQTPRRRILFPEESTSLSSPIRFFTTSRDKGRKRALDDEVSPTTSPIVKLESPSTPKRQRRLLGNVKNVLSLHPTTPSRPSTGLRLVTASPPSRQSKAASLSKAIDFAERFAQACPERVDAGPHAIRMAKLRKELDKQEVREAKDKVKREERKARAKMMEDAERVEVVTVESQFDYERQNQLVEEIKLSSRQELRYVVPLLQCTEKR